MRTGANPPGLHAAADNSSKFGIGLALLATAPAMGVLALGGWLAASLGDGYGLVAAIAAGVLAAGWIIACVALGTRRVRRLLAGLTAAAVKHGMPTRPGEGADTCKAAEAAAYLDSLCADQAASMRETRARLADQARALRGAVNGAALPGVRGDEAVYGRARELAGRMEGCMAAARLLSESIQAEERSLREAADGLRLIRRELADVDGGAAGMVAAAKENKEISVQTHILSILANVEAVNLEGDEGFKVIAQEVKQLAAISTDSAFAARESAYALADSAARARALAGDAFVRAGRCLVRAGETAGEAAMLLNRLEQCERLLSALEGELDRENEAGRALERLRAQAGAVERALPVERSSRG